MQGGLLRRTQPAPRQNQTQIYKVVPVLLSPYERLVSHSSLVEETRRAAGAGTGTGTRSGLKKRRARRSKCRASQPICGRPKSRLRSRPETTICQIAGKDPDSQCLVQRAM